MTQLCEIANKVCKIAKSMPRQLAKRAKRTPSRLVADYDMSGEGECLNRCRVITWPHDFVHLTSPT